MKSSKRPFNLAIRAVDQERYEISIRGIIGEYVDYERWTISDTEKDVLNELKQIPQDAAIDCRINSRGGDVGLGLGIYNALSQRRKNLTTYNDGYAMSAGSIVLLAGSKRVCPTASITMIHRAQGGVDGTGEDMRSLADGMDVIDNMMAKVYAEISGKKTADEFLAMMKKTSFFDGQGALDIGLATHCEGDISAPEDDDDDISDAEKRIIASFEKHIPANLRSRVLPKAITPIASLPAAQPAATNKQPTAKKMNKIIAALVAAGFTVATDAQEDAVLPIVNTLITDRKNFKASLDGHETALKNRVTKKVEAAVTDKLVKAERKDALIKAALTDESMLDFIDDLRAEAANKTPRGAQPARRQGEEEGEDVEKAIEANDEIIHGRRTDVSKRTETIRANLKLRGLDNLVKKPASTAAN
ncbi:MAG TPA: Clp protease ClpP [Candidatus Polarisedimenticolia bacterium]|nr:Clp protease ClpP [Candidatus Polarisedimenticolia bacterium]